MSEKAIAEGEGYKSVDAPITELTHYEEVSFVGMTSVYLRAYFKIAPLTGFHQLSQQTQKSLSLVSNGLENSIRYEG